LECLDIGQRQAIRILRERPARHETACERQANHQLSAGMHIVMLHAPVAEVQCAVRLSSCIAEVQHAVGQLDSAIDNLERALGRLDNEDFPAAMRELAGEMSLAADGVRLEFDCGNFSENADKLGELADKKDEKDEDELDYESSRAANHEIERS
jgi:hypothetical protein